VKPPSIDPMHEGVRSAIFASEAALVCKEQLIRLDRDPGLPRAWREMRNRRNPVRAGVDVSQEWVRTFGSPAPSLDAKELAIGLCFFSAGYYSAFDHAPRGPRSNMLQQMICTEFEHREKVKQIRPMIDLHIAALRWAANYFRCDEELAQPQTRLAPRPDPDNS